MAARLLHSLTDDNPDFQKQIGCMTGIFQLFDRQNMLTGGRRIVGHGPKELPLGKTHFNGGSLERETNSVQLRSASEEKYNMQDRQKVSTESSQASFSSSSHSSSFSSLDCNRASHLEPSSFDRTTAPMSLRSSSPQFSQQTLDLRDFLKDSMYREVQGLSIKANTIEEKQTTPADLKESLRALAKLQETPRYHNEPRELLRSSSYHSKDRPSFSVSKDAPRFSHDGRETNRSSFDLRGGSKSSLKLKEFPRLSLDSREGSMRTVNADSKSNLLLESMQKDSGVFDDGKVQTQQQTPGNQTRPPSVVAKLMGLEILPDPVSSSRSYPHEDSVNISSSFEKTDSSRPNSSLKNLWKEPGSPRWRNPDGLIKPMARFPIEPAPWKQIDGTRGSQKSASKSTKGSANGTTAFPSVYSEIEKRLKDLEFAQSGKDLRALKQILEAMQAKGFMETPKEEQDSNFSSHIDHEQKNITSTTSVDNRKPIKKKNVSANYESPIVIVKPAKRVERSCVPSASIVSLDGLSGRPNKGLSSVRTSKDPIFKSIQRDNAVNSVNMKNNKTLKTIQNSGRSQQLAKEGSGKISGSISPRMQQKKLEMEKWSGPPTTPDSSKSRRQSNRQQAEYNSPGGKRRPKLTNSQQSDDQLSEVSVESRNSNPHENEDSAQSNETIINGSTNGGLIEKKSTLTLSEEESAESGSVSMEYLSPVSVLDNVAYKHDSPSPIKYIGKTLKVETLDKERNSNAVKQNSSENFISNSTEYGATFEMNRKKLQNIDNLVQKLRRLNSSHDEARTDYIASLCENTNPDHRHVSEILLASGLLLRDLTDFQFHPSGHPINPELFLVLEQTKASASPKEEKKTARLATNEKHHRKLVFDVVNEILVRKLASAGPNSEPWVKPAKLARKALTAQELLRELCCEIEGLRAKKTKCSSDDHEDRIWKSILCEDVMHRSERWMGFDGEISDAVLHIERLIFKDLVDEVMLGESADLITKPGRRKLVK